MREEVVLGAIATYRADNNNKIKIIFCYNTWARSPPQSLPVKGIHSDSTCAESETVSAGPGSCSASKSVLVEVERARTAFVSKVNGKCGRLAVEGGRRPHSPATLWE